MSWNPVLNKVIEIKREWEKQFSDEFGKPIRTFTQMLEDLDSEEYNDLFKAIQINQEGKFILFRYGMDDLQEGMWTDPNSIYREMRSVVIDIEKECLVLTPFRKFFNVNEVEENKLDRIIDEISSVHSVNVQWTNKLDGSMQSARWYEGKIMMSGSKSLNPEESWRLQEGRKMLTDNHIKLIQDFDKATFIFEMIHPKDKHVVNYTSDKKGMYLIGIRDVNSGYEYSPVTIEFIAEEYGIPYAKRENKTLYEVLEEMKTVKANEKEGWVLDISGHKIKFKCDDYVELHRLVDKISSINTIIKNVAEDRVDDMISKVPDAYKDRVRKLSQIVIDWKAKVELDVEMWYNSIPDNLTEKKDIMIWIDSYVIKDYRGLVKKRYLGEPLDLLMKRGGYYKKGVDLGIEKEVQEVYESE